MVSHKLQIQKEKKKMKHESEQNPTKTARFSKTHINMYMLLIYLDSRTHTYTNHWQRSVNEWCGALKAIPYRAHNNEDLTELLYTGRLYNTIIWLLINGVIDAFLILLLIFHICCIPLSKHRCNCYTPKLCVIFLFSVAFRLFIYSFK